MHNMLSWFQPVTDGEPKKSAPNSKSAVAHYRIGFANMKHAIKNEYLILNTLPDTSQACLIQGTVVAAEEEDTINALLENDDGTDRIIILYGQNACDTTVDAKMKELKGLGFPRVHIYAGGLFEWLLLQDIYGDTEFATTSKITDILLFQPPMRKF